MYCMKKGDSLAKVYYWILQADAEDDHTAVIQLYNNNKWWISNMKFEAKEQLRDIYKRNIELGGEYD